MIRASLLALAAAALLLSGCARLPWIGPRASEPAAMPAPRPPPPAPQGARTPEALDTTSAAERAAASAPAGGGRLLGRAVVTLGDPADPGFWVTTPLVAAPGPGRVSLPGGASAKVELRPAEAGVGARISLPALRLLGVPLTALPEVEIYSGG